MMTQAIIRVRDVMQHDVDIIDGKCTVSQALAQLKHIETRLMMVDKRHEDDEYGLVRLGDIARQVLAKDRSPDRVNIYEIMSKPVISVPPTMDIRYCARFFKRFGLQRAPVIDQGKVVGVIGYDEMLLHWLNLGERNASPEVEEVISEKLVAEDIANEE